MPANLLLPCIHNGRNVQHSFAEAHQLLWSVSIGFVSVADWLRFGFDGFEGRHHLAELGVRKAALSFGLALMTRGRRALTLRDMQDRHPDDAMMDGRCFNQRASRFAEAFPAVPRQYRPYRYLDIAERRCTQPAYMMRPDLSWFLVFAPEVGAVDVDWDVLLTPPIGLETVAAA